MSWSILEGDCIDVMRTLPAESVDAIVTSPPYAMQRKATYGGVPESEYPAWTVAWMAEARRLLKPDGSVVINIRPHVRNGQISDYTLRTRLALREDGWAECEELIWFKRSSPPMGSARRPRRAWESMHWFAKHGSPWTDVRANGNHSERIGGEGGRGYVVQPSDGFTIGISRSMDVAEVALGRPNRWDQDNIDHPAPYPPALAEWVGKLICPQGGTILDPFSGSASTGVACIRNGWDYIGIEAMPEYAAMSRRRLAHTEAEHAA